MAKGKGTRNDNRSNGKASKKNPKTNTKIGKTVDGYSSGKLKIRAEKRKPENARRSKELAEKVATADLTK